jgi:hypothetical protein
MMNTVATTSQGWARTWDLGQDTTLRLPSRPDGLAVHVISGEVLVTREGDPVDHVLGAGNDLHLSGRGLTVAWALSTARLVLAPE